MQGISLVVQLDVLCVLETTGSMGDGIVFEQIRNELTNWGK